MGLHKKKTLNENAAAQILAQWKDLLNVLGNIRKQWQHSPDYDFLIHCLTLGTARFKRAWRNLRWWSWCEIK